MLRSLITLLTATLLLGGCASAPAPRVRRVAHREHTFGPWSVSDHSPTVSSAPARSSSGHTTDSSFVTFAFAVYSNYITKIDGVRCEHRPTCSRYAVEALRKHGPVIGALMTIDRLLRGKRSSALRFLPVYKVEDGRTYFADPVERNDFFF